MKNFREGIFGGQTSTLDRLCALTDGVYAIVITLLVLDLKIPEMPGLSEAQLVEDLIQQIPNFVSYTISFFVVAFLWMRHHWILKPLKTCDEKAFWINFVHILFLSVTPYTSSLFGHYEEDPIAVVLFSGNLGLAGLSLLLLHRYVLLKPEWHNESAEEGWTRPNWWTIYPGPIFALGSILLSFISITGAFLIWLLLPLWALLLPHR